MINGGMTILEEKIYNLIKEINNIRIQIALLKELKQKSIKIISEISLLNLKLFCKSIELTNLSNYAGIENPDKKSRRRNLQ